MTIGIGVLCSERIAPQKPRPDHLVLVADTMGSTLIDSTDDLHKLYVFPDERIYATCADSIERAGDLLPIIHSEVKGIHGLRTHGTLLNALNRAVHQHRAHHFQWDVIASKYSFIPGQTAQQDYPKILEEWQQYYVGAQLIIGTFDDAKEAHLYYLGPLDNSFGWVHPIAFPGVCAIGSGGDNARFWLHYRRHTLSLAVKQSIYHAYEAKRMAEKSPFVNKDIEILIASHERHWYLSNQFAGQFPREEEAIVSLSDLSSMFDKYKPPATEDLGHPKQSTSRTSKDQ